MQYHIPTYLDMPMKKQEPALLSLTLLSTYESILREYIVEVCRNSCSLNFRKRVYN